MNDMNEFDSFDDNAAEEEIQAAEFVTPGDTPTEDEERRKKIMIGVGIAVVLCCCCVVFLAAAWYGGDALLNMLGI